ncbi:putative Phospholipase D [Cupriavidus phytorum]|uniref:Phospholipase D n=2 Tax=Cupriavidus TaxID=106589 RepID=A0A976AC80_9BURK|nr:MULTISPECIES: phospholipase D-like domain-containing protein [Cupriavidus]PZX25999.1 phospholipase D1/2 [Cupriavidus alkaliphilus]SOY76322.1 putative Phospholipase D [Cupriavidus taiwanensis]
MAGQEKSSRVLTQIIGKEGRAAQGAATSNLWVGHSAVFSKETAGNKVVSFTTGREYFADFIAACEKASQEICIIGWQVNWDAMLAPGKRLWDVLCEAAKRKVKIYVLPWDDTSPVQTYDDQTCNALEAINTHLGYSSKEKCVHVAVAKSNATKNTTYFSHHQKLVVIDREIAFVGGIDLAYGRYDDASYDLRADGDGRKALNRYNPCIAWLGSLDKGAKDIVDPDLLTGAADSFKLPGLTNSTADGVLKQISSGGVQVPYSEPTMDAVGANAIGLGRRAERNRVQYVTLNAAVQPRMPWQDVHSRIEGPAVSDLLRNFVVRWNVVSKMKLPMPKPPSTYEKRGNAHVQVLRSAPAGMRKAEYDAMQKKPETAPTGTEDDIHRAMLQLIAKSRRFIYIESQFFVSDFGEEADFVTGSLSPAAKYINDLGGKDASKTAKRLGVLDDDAPVGITLDGFKPRLKVDDSKLLNPPTNRVCSALVTRITRAILDKDRPPFHVYITLPVHPEGSLLNASIAVQVYWTMQTIAFGSKSLLNGIRRALKARELREKKDPRYMRVIEDDRNREYESIPVAACFDYVTLLNLRNWKKLGERYVTEQIYVHSKLMVVDDLYALLGSANINDRSLLGERDSEIAVLVMDDDHRREDINGKGSQQPVRVFAHELRKKIWGKLFGLTAGGRKAANELRDAVLQPGKPDSWRMIQKRAEANAKAYEAAFKHVPRNWSPFEPNRPASILPNWDPLAQKSAGAGASGAPAYPQPAEDAFWQKPRHEPAGVKLLESVTGFITSLPIHWTRGENNRFPYPTALVAHNDEPHDSGERYAMQTQSGDDEGLTVFSTDDTARKEHA